VHRVRLLSLFRSISITANIIKQATLANAAVNVALPLRAIVINATIILPARIPILMTTKTNYITLANPAASNLSSRSRVMLLVQNA
jgi:hypothetical protein